MKRWILTILATSLLLPLTAWGLDCTNPRHASKPQCQDGGGDTGDTNGDNLVADFCLDFLSGPFTSDGTHIMGTDGELHDYCADRKQKVSIATGQGPGFEFDSYIRSNGDWIRKVRVDFPGGSVAASGYDEFGNELYSFVFLSGNYKMVYRFDQDEGGLDLGSLANVGDIGYVSAFMGLFMPDGNFARLAHGSVPNPGVSRALYGNACVQDHTMDALVTRTGINPDTWTIETMEGQPNVCLWDFDSGLENQPGVVVSMPYKFTLTRQ
jgi:hypothetical protein